MGAMQIADFQKVIRDVYYDLDAGRGLEGTFMWFVEEVGELATDLRRLAAAPDQADRENLKEEFADVFAWLCTLANLSGVALDEAVAKYASGCPGCKQTPCTCRDKH
jgi:NTP pyrophosphatase (non-canonical NTP hydrolase)